MQDAVDEGLRWLLHIDSDELFFTSHPSVDAHFAALDVDGVTQMTYLNHEGVPEREDVGDFFRHVTLFRRHHFTVPMTPAAKRGMAFWERRTNHVRWALRKCSHVAVVLSVLPPLPFVQRQFLLCYDNGKSACRVSADAYPASVHSWHVPDPHRARTALGAWWALFAWWPTRLVDGGRVCSGFVFQCSGPTALGFVPDSAMRRPLHSALCVLRPAVVASKVRHARPIPQRLA